MRISDWSSDVCSSDLAENRCLAVAGGDLVEPHQRRRQSLRHRKTERELGVRVDRGDQLHALQRLDAALRRSEEHTSEPQSLMRISYAVCCLNKKKNTKPQHQARCQLVPHTKYEHH